MNYLEVSLEPKTFSLISTYETSWSQTKTQQNKQQRPKITKTTSNKSKKTKKIRLNCNWACTAVPPSNVFVYIFSRSIARIRCPRWHWSSTSEAPTSRLWRLLGLRHWLVRIPFCCCRCLQRERAGRLIRLWSQLCLSANLWQKLSSGLLHE